MPWQDIHSGSHTAHMWVSDGTAHVSLTTASVNLIGWGSSAVVAQVNNSSFYPANKVDVYAPTRDSYFPTSVSVGTDGKVSVGYAGGAAGSRITSTTVSYNIC